VTTRDRILEATAELFRRYGYTGTGLKQIVAAANAPFGSVYHHFPGGKAELGEQVIRRSGRMYQELVMSVWDASGDPVAALGAIFAGAGEVLRATDFIDPCPIAVVALEVASSNEALRRATSGVFEEWIAAASERLVGAGIDAAAARRLSLVMVELLEGGFMMARAVRDTEALDAAGDAAVALVQAALAGSRRRARRDRR
jgi:AcrR family transcriptional regulator